MPQRPRVWPRSSSCFSRPIEVATSLMPNTPNVLLKAKRAMSTTASPGLPWIRLLNAIQGSLRLAKKLRTQVRTGSGTTAL